MAKRCPKPERGWRGAGACVWVQAAGTQLCKQGRSGWGGGNGAKLPRLRAPKVFPAVHPASKGELTPRCPCWGARGGGCTPLVLQPGCGCQPWGFRGTEGSTLATFGCDVSGRGSGAGGSEGAGLCSWGVSSSWGVDKLERAT